MKRVMLAFGILALALPVWAQTGGISGTVTDDTGGILPGAVVTLTGPGGTRVESAGSGGGYEFPNLEPGTYTIAVSMSGFSVKKSDDIVVADSTVEVPFTLRLAPLGETIVVSASKIESTLTNAPATLSVVSSNVLANAPSQNFGEILRSVPGVNVIQMSARDVQLTNRQATSTLSTSQLTLLDGRSIYLDFFGFVIWDLIPSNSDEIKQIEVVRGPASAVWGANALTGVVNIITKSPREAEGLRLGVSGGFFDRKDGSRADEGNGKAFGFNASFADAPNDSISYRISGGYYDSDPYSRPVGVQTLTDPVSGASFPCSGAPFTGCVPLSRHPADSSIIAGGAPYPIDSSDPNIPPGLSFSNSGTKQPKAELRVDQELEGGGRITYSGGYAGTAGIIHTGIGPFDIQDGSYMAYGRVGYTKRALKIAAFGNFLDVEAPNLLLPDPNNPGGQVQLTFNTQTYDFEIGHSTVVGGNNVLSYGGNVRRNNFEITLTPEAENRTELGAYFQDEIIWDKLRLSLGARVDKFGNIDDPVFSPRATAMFKPAQEHSIRLSFNRAFRSPSAVNNYLDQNIYAPAAPIDFTPFLQACRFGLLPPGFCSLVPTQPVPLVVRNIGSDVASNDPTDRSLKEESLDALEISYTGTFGGRTTLGIAAYQNDTDNNINFVQVTPTPNNPRGLPGFDVYTLDNPPPGIPAPVYGALVAAVGPLPRTVSTYLNLGPIRQRGLELSLDHRFNKDVSAFVNYSFQDNPEVLAADADQIPYPPEEVGLPSRHRFNVGFNLNSDRFIANASLNFTDKAFWQDVLSLPFHGYTDSFTMVNASFGVKFAEGKVTALVKGTNLTNETIQQHVYGDVIKRSLFAELRIFVD